MRFNPAEMNQISSLLAMLQQGGDPADAVPVIGDVLADRDQRIAERKAALSDYTNQILGMAGAGQPLGAANTYLSSLEESGLVGNRMMNRLEDVTREAYDAYARPGGGVPLYGPGSQNLSALAEAYPQQTSPLASPAAVQQYMGDAAAPPEMPGPVETLAEWADSLAMFAQQGQSKQEAINTLLSTGVDPMATPTIQQLADQVWIELGL